MIGKLIGIIEDIYGDLVTLNVSGICFEITVPSAEKYLEVGASAKILISMQIRENDVSLYGFITNEEKNLFKELIQIKGVGPKVAVSIISGANYNEIVEALIRKDNSIFKKVSGIGAKLAERIIAEMQGKPLSRLDSPSIVINHTAEINIIDKLVKDAVSALVSLGFARAQAFTVCRNLLKENPEMTISDIIKNALKELA